jgi:hypothetical protein
MNDYTIKIVDQHFNGLKEDKVLPLFTKQGLAERWKTTRQNVNNWEGRHIDFCRPIDGIVIGGGRYYPLFEVERYERARGLNHGGN